MTFYLKYRPQTVEELDNQAVREQITALFSNNHFPHAYLFTGPKGIGKTSTARIIAKIVNCTKGSAFEKKWVFREPCNQCDQCLSITNGSNIDVMEIDAASNRGIDEIRILRDRIGYLPALGKYKVFIIDEVHMLTKEAFNALLKTLEEPPVHTLFILCTTEAHKIPPTIASRCIKITFQKAQKEEMFRSLKRITDREKITIDSSALDMLTQLSDGSFRDAVKILEQAAGVSADKPVTFNIIRALFQMNYFDEKEIVTSILAKNVPVTLSLINRSVEAGTDPKIINRQILLNLRTMLLAQVSQKSFDRKKYLTLKKLIDLLILADSQMKYSPLSQLPLEMAVVEFCFDE